MKKFLEEFKAFALKGNVMNMAVGVIIGAAFSDLVTSFTTNIIQPVIACIGSAEVQGRINLFGTGNYIDYGAFISSVIYFIIMAFVIFMMVKTMNKLMDLGKKKKRHLRRLRRSAPTVRVRSRLMRSGVRTARLN